jgi:hypothetical protein
MGKKRPNQAIEILRERAPSNELFYSFVMDCLKDYHSPRVKLSHLIQTGALIRVKKGIYIFGPLFSKNETCLEMLANLIFGPSYISLEWALSYYGMIPEKVEEITSVTFKVKKQFDTPIGRFSYAHIDLDRYPSDVLLIERSHSQKFFIASREKALCDTLIIRRGRISSIKYIKEVLFEDFRIEIDEILKLNIQTIKQINSKKSHSALTFLIKFLEKVKSE